MAGKFIPDSDSGFARMARVFSDNIALEPERYFLTAEDARDIGHAVSEFRHHLALASWPSTRSTRTIMEKDAARQRAERIVRKFGALIRANPQISQSAKVCVGVRERPGRLRRRECPKHAPHLRYLGSERGVHLLEFREEWGNRSRAKPRGASRLELFIEMVEPGRAIPESPRERPWYLRSFTSSPMRVEFPTPAGPRMIVYWGRWADATGEVGPWSQRVVARVEGWEMPPKDATGKAAELTLSESADPSSRRRGRCATPRLRRGGRC